MGFEHQWFFLIIAVILFSGCSGMKKECSVTSDCNASAMCLNETCVLKPGCDYNNPACDSDYECKNNSCIKKAGCLYDNPSCNYNFDCVNNECIRKHGCDYQNPACGFGSDCKNNTCIRKVGCDYDNPVCGPSSVCINNTCMRKAGCFYENPKCASHSDCINNTCIRKPGCEFDNPACASDSECLNNTCAKKTGCEFNNPPCALDSDCKNNTCIRKVGCTYDNPPCGPSFDCISNECVLKPGCDYNNPPCGTGYVCKNNQCFRQLSSAEKEEILGLVSAFNASRNKPVQYSSGYGAEEACKRFTGIYYYKETTGRDTLTLADAAIACQMVNTDTPGACGYPTRVEGTLQFGIDAFNIDNNLTAFFNAISVLTPENTAGKLAEAKGYVLGARAGAASAAASMLRWDASCTECIGICPAMPYDLGSLDAAAERLH